VLNEVETPAGIIFGADATTITTLRPGSCHPETFTETKPEAAAHVPWSGSSVAES